MVKLFCAIVGKADSAFEVKINDAESVSALKKAIKAEEPNKLKDVDADELQLSLEGRAQDGYQVRNLVRYEKEKMYRISKGISLVDTEDEAYSTRCVGDE